MAASTRFGRKGAARAASVLGALALLLSAAPAGAREVPGYGVTEARPKASRSYPGMTTERPNLPPTDWNFDECRNSDFCDLAPISVDQGRPNGHDTVVRIFWDPSIGGAEIETRFYNKGGGEPIRVLQKVDEGYFEESVVDLPAGDYWIGAMCYNGDCSSGYRTEVEIDYEELYVAPEEEETNRPTFTPAPPPTESETPTPTQAAAPSIPPPPVRTPGEDGERVALPLDAVAAGQQAKTPSDTGVRITNIVLFSLLALIVFGGGTGLYMHIRRDLRM